MAKISVYIPYALSDLQREALNVWLATICSHVEKRRPYERRSQRRAEEVRDQRELLLLRLELWRDDLQNQHLITELDALRRTIRQRVHDFWMVGVSNGEQLGMSYNITSAMRRFAVDVQAYQPMYWQRDNITPTELEQLVSKIGALPKHRIEIISLDDMPEDHILLGYMAADLCDEYHAWAKVDVKPNFHTTRAATEWSREDTYALIDGMDGAAFEICYATRRNGDPLLYHLADGDFMRDWVEHPQYYIHA